MISWQDSQQEENVIIPIMLIGKWDDLSRVTLEMAEHGLQ